MVPDVNSWKERQISIKLLSTTMFAFQMKAAYFATAYLYLKKSQNCDAKGLTQTRVLLTEMKRMSE